MSVPYNSLDKQIIFNQSRDAHIEPVGGWWGGIYVAFWNAFIQLIASHPIRSAPSVPNWLSESLLKAFKDVSNNKRGVGCWWGGVSKRALDHSWSKRINNRQAKPSLIHLIHIFPLLLFSFKRNHWRKSCSVAPRSSCKQFLKNTPLCSCD